MGLFSILKQDSTATALASSSLTEKASSTSTSTSLSLMTVVQFYTHQPALTNLTTTTTTTTTTTPPYALLTYQSIATSEVLTAAANKDETVSAGPSLRKTNVATNTAALAPPDLGLWNCRILTNNNNSSNNNNNNNSSEALLRKMLAKTSNKSNSKPTSFILTVDLTSPFANVEPNLTALQNALIRYLLETDTNSINNTSDVTRANNPTQTTSLQQLRDTQFGLAVQDQEYNAPTPTVPVPADQDDKVAVMILVRLGLPDTYASSTSHGTTTKENKQQQRQEQDDYQSKQQKALLSYHLRKFALELQATLLFVNDDGDNHEDAKTNTNNNDRVAAATEQPTVTSAQAAGLVRAWATGNTIWQDTMNYIEEDAWTTTTTTETTTTEQVHAAVYGPGAYQQDLLETTLLRAAQYPGHWDAKTDSLWKILPSSKTNTSGGGTVKTTKSDDNLRDVAWLTELRRSIVATDASAAAAATTPQPTKKKKDTTPAKTPNDAAAFFESLLK